MFQHNDHRPLQHFVLKGRDPQRALASIALGDVRPPHRWCAVAFPGFGTVQQTLEVLFQVRGVVRSVCPSMPTAPSLRVRLRARPMLRFGPAFCLTHSIGPHDKCLSELDHAACRLPLYASQPGLPQQHAPLGSGRWPALPDAIPTC